MGAVVAFARERQVPAMAPEGQFDGKSDPERNAVPILTV